MKFDLSTFNCLLNTNKATLTQFVCTYKNTSSLEENEMMNKLYNKCTLMQKTGFLPQTLGDRPTEGIAHLAKPLSLVINLPSLLCCIDIYWDLSELSPMLMKFLCSIVMLFKCYVHTYNFYKKKKNHFQVYKDYFAKSDAKLGDTNRDEL